MSKASEISKGLRARLEQVNPANGYLTQIQRVYGPADKPRDKAPMPLVLIRPQADTKTSVAGFQATRVRTYEIEVQFAKSADEADLSNAHVDILRALGFGQDQPERKFPGLLEDEDQAEFRFATEGETTHSITLTIGVLYVESYN
ncbi:hypothetical protein [Stutzerimonas stutzeri]|uniref:hypothetical protein n=1 Tax=Stutzerimonas stutzeri TaxID=316 RepID=UPI00265A9C21|nr:hypothetical protein [Stutzerimonas stutzeri]MCF6780915.1 hypothetical protein [Stutzerimonas stutzeri]MCF6803484.1 hypothetical protein [Stutzerimonas stutzeri]